MTPLDSVRYATTWSESTADAYGADIRTSHDIAGRCVSALAAIDTAVFRPFATYGARLRRIRFFHLNTGSELVVKHRDELTVTGRGNRLCLSPAHLLRCVVKRLSHI